MGFQVLVEGSGDPEVSVLMPVWEQEAMVARAVVSVLSQQNVVAEILISDDSSRDATVERVRDSVSQVVRAEGVKHRVLLREGDSRLRRDHFALLVDAASCDRVLFAHGDDVAAPDRAATLVDALRQPGVVLAGCGGTGGDTAPARALTSEPDTEVYSRVSSTELIRPKDAFGGARVAWNRRAVAGFQRLDASFAACSHDKILAFRASLVGDAVVVGRGLLERRHNPRSWSQSLWDKRSRSSGIFGASLHHLSALRGMRRDLDLAHRLGYVDDTVFAELSNAIDEDQERQLGRLVTAHEELTNAGKATLWVSEQDVNLAYRGDLMAALERRAFFANLNTRRRRMAYNIHAAARRLRRRFQKSK